MGRGAALRSGHRRRRGALRSSRAPCRVRSRSRGWPLAGRGGSLQHLPLLPLPAAQIKKQQKATNHPRAERGAARRGGRRAQRAAPRLSRRRAWLGAGWAGLGRGAGRCVCEGRLCRSSSARTPALAATAASAAAASTSPLRQRRLCRRRRRCAPARPGALNAARGLPAKPGPDSPLPPPPPPRLPSLLPLPPSQRSSGHLDAAGSEAGAAAAAPPAPRALVRSVQAQLPSASFFTFFFFAQLYKKKERFPQLPTPLL